MRDYFNPISAQHSKFKGMSINSICLWVCYACCALSGFVPQLILSLIVVVCVAVICSRDDAVAVWPIMIFYYSIFGTVFGISVYRIFTILFLLARFYKNRTLKIQYRIVPSLSVYIYYLAVVVSAHSVRTMLFAFVDIICAILLVCDHLEDEDKLKKFFSSYVMAALLAFISGLVIGNTESVMQDYGGTLLTISRFSATFEDPNYMGFFYTVAVFAIVTLKMYRPPVRMVIIVALYGVILTSMSMTAIIGNVLLWTLYLLIRGNIRLKTVATAALVLFVAISLYNYGLEHPKVKLIGDMSLRIQDKLNSLFLKDFDSFSTGRTSLSESHLSIFKELSIIRQLFGGRAVNSYYIDVAHGANYSAHNEYIDMLLNVGMVGWVIMYGSIGINAIKKVLLFRKKKERTLLCGMMINLAWLYYVATLTVFLDFRYMFAFFI